MAKISVRKFTVEEKCHWQARAKFSILCQLVEEGGMRSLSARRLAGSVAGAAKRAGERISQAEKAFSKAEDSIDSIRAVMVGIGRA